VTSYLVVAGMPGSGKTTVANAIAQLIDLPVYSHDVVKEMLFDRLGYSDREWSRAVGLAAKDVLIYAAVEARRGVVEAFWTLDDSDRFRDLRGSVLQVYCDCPSELARERFRLRAPNRHRGHRDDLVDYDTERAWSPPHDAPIRDLLPVLRVRTDVPLDLDVLRVALGSHATQLRTAAERTAGKAPRA
jgi:hypothetical protein